MKKFICSLLMVLSLVAVMTPVRSNAAVKNLIAMPTNSRSFCQVTLDDKTFNSSKTKYAKVTVKIGDGINMSKTSPYYRVVLTDDCGRWLWESAPHSIKGTTTFQLGNDHKVYRMYFYVDNSNLNNADAFLNSGKFGYWNITKTSKCSVSAVTY